MQGLFQINLTTTRNGSSLAEEALAKVGCHLVPSPERGHPVVTMDANRTDHAQSAQAAESAKKALRDAGLGHTLGK